MVVAVRSVGERSLPLCLDALRNQCNKVVLIEERPFVRAVQKTFEAGSRFPEEDFLLGLDADIVLYDGAAKRMEDEAAARLREHQNLLKIDYLLDDKFRGRIYGCHLYVNRHSQALAEFFSTVQYDEAQKRPESRNLSVMKKRLGLSTAYSKEAAGSHDFEQYYGHIYAKYVNRGGRDWVSIDKIRRGVTNRKPAGDQDFNVAIAGLDASSAGKVFTHAGKYPNAAEVLARLGLSEKAPLAR